MEDDPWKKMLASVSVVVKDLLGEEMFQNICHQWTTPRETIGQMKETLSSGDAIYSTSQGDCLVLREEGVHFVQSAVLNVLPSSTGPPFRSVGFKSNEEGWEEPRQKRASKRFKRS